VGAVADNPRKPATDAAALLIDRCVSQLRFPDRESPPRLRLSWDDAAECTGKDFAKSTRDRLVESGTMTMISNYWSGSHARQWEWRRPLSGTPHLYVIQTKPARRRRITRTPSTPSTTSSSTDAVLQLDLLRSGRVTLSSNDLNLAGEQMAQHSKAVLCWRSAAELLAGNWSASQDEGGRLHTAISRMPSVVRHALRIDDEPVAEVDISNLNPLIMAREAVWETRRHDAEWWLTLCERGEFYQALSSEAHVTMSTAKRGFQVVMNSHRRSHENSKVGDAWWRLFPSSAGWLRGWKRGGGKRAAYDRCTPIESRAVLGTVAQLIQSGIPCLSVHDAIVVGESHASAVADALGAAIRQEIATGCTIKLKRAGEVVDRRTY